MLSQRRSLVLASLGEAPGCGSSKAHESSPSEKCNRTPGAQKDKQDVSSIANWLLGNIPSFKSHPERWYLLYSPSRYRRIFPSVKRPSRTSSGCGDPSRRLILPSSTPDPEPVKQCASVSETSASSLSTHDNHSATPALPEASCSAIPEAAKDAIITVRPNYPSKEHFQALSKLCLTFVLANFRCRKVMMEARVPSAVARRSLDKVMKHGYQHQDTGIAAGGGRKAKPLGRATYVPRYVSREDNLDVMEQFIYALLREAGRAYEDTVTFAALLLLHRYRCKFPAGKRPSAYGHRLFLVAYVIAYKTMGDYARPNKDLVLWLNRETYPLPVEVFAKTLNRSERLFCDILGWNMYITPSQLESFTRRVKEDYTGEGPYPEYASASHTFGSTRRTTAETVDADSDSEEEDCTLSECGDY